MAENWVFFCPANSAHSRLQILIFLEKRAISTNLADKPQVEGVVCVQLANGFGYLRGLNGPSLCNFFKVPAKAKSLNWWFCLERKERKSFHKTYLALHKLGVFYCLAAFKLQRTGCFIAAQFASVIIIWKNLMILISSLRFLILVLE